MLLQYYPFLKQSQSVIQDLDITFEKIDQTNTYDEILKEAFGDILNSVIKKEINEQGIINKIEKSNIGKEVSKFYLSLMIVKPSTILAKYFIKSFVKKFEVIVNYINNSEKDEVILLNYISLFKEFGLDWKLIKSDGLYFVKIHMNNYLDFAVLIESNDPPMYQVLKLVNCGVYNGYVYFYYKDYNEFQLMLNKLLEERIRQLVKNIQENIECKKIETCRNHLSKYMKDKHGASYVPNAGGGGVTTENYELSQQDLLNNEEILTTFKKYLNDETFLNILQFQLPPCVWVILSQIVNKKQPLSHYQNILLASYLSTKGYTVEQIQEFYKQTVNFNEKISKYNIKYVIDKKLKPMNCSKLDIENLCHKQLDRSDQCVKLKNPLSYKQLQKNE